MSAATTDEVAHEGEKQSRPPLKLSDSEIDPANIWGDDALAREKVAVALTNLVKPETGPLVLTLNGGWGTGKTFFLRRWQAQLEHKESLKAIYFNAWEDDYCVDPLVAIIGQLCDEFNDKKYEAEINVVVQAAKKVSTKLALKGLGALSCGLFNLSPDEINSGRDILDTILRELADVNSQSHQSTRGRLFDEYNESRTSRNELRNALTALTKKIREESKAPLIFIIDELDRCRPTFAIELLERIKHLFGISNLVFVLGIDREQLGSSIKSVYGDIEVDAYLRRFFDMEFSLRPVNSGAFCEGMLKKYGMDTYAQVLDGKSKGNSYQNAHQTVESVLPFLCRKLALSLRDVESLVRSYVFVMRSEKNSQNNWPVLLSILLVLRLKNSGLYARFTQGKAGAGEVLDYIEADYGHMDSDSESNDIYRANWVAVTAYSCQRENYANSLDTSKELESLKNNDGLPQNLFSHLSKRTIGLSIDAKEKFFKLQEVEHSHRTMSVASTKRAIESILGVVEL